MPEAFLNKQTPVCGVWGSNGGVVRVGPIVGVVSGGEGRVVSVVPIVEVFSGGAGRRSVL